MRSIGENTFAGSDAIPPRGARVAPSQDHQGVLIDPVAEHLAAQVSHGPYRARWTFPVLKAVIYRALLLLIRIPRPAMLPFQELIAAELALLPSVAEHDAV